MKKTLRILVAALAVLMVCAGPALAASSEFILKDTIRQSTAVEGDLVAVGESVKVDAAVGGDIITLGRNIIIDQREALQNLFAAGQNVTVNLTGGRSVYAAGLDVSVSAESELSGAYLAGGTVSFDGTAQDVYAAGGRVNIGGTIYGRLVIRSERITFDENVSVGDGITIYASRRPTLPDSIDKSQVTYKSTGELRAPTAEWMPQWTKGGVRSKIIAAAIGVVSSVVLALVLEWAAGRPIGRAARELRRKFGKALLGGFIALVVVPAAALLIMLTIVGIPLSLLALALYALLLSIAPVLAGVVAGRAILRRTNRFLAASLGAAALRLLLLVPYLRVLLCFLSAVYAFGFVLLAICPGGRRKRVREHPDGPDRAEA